MFKTGPLQWSYQSINQRCEVNVGSTNSGSLHQVNMNMHKLQYEPTMQKYGLIKLESIFKSSHANFTCQAMLVPTGENYRIQWQ